MNSINESPKRFGTIDGVFTPTILTIIGVIMYLRLGWVVGNTGFLGALIIILLAHVATVTTGLAMSSMTTNVKIGDGGFYSLISRSLGLEVGGAIGISLYISQALSVALYIVGFTEVWLSIFPKHNPHLVSSVVLAAILILSLISAKAVMKFQYVIMFAIVLSLFSFFMGKGGEYELVLWNSGGEASFWVVFAVFFPAVTGISAGAAMSGELKNPKRNIPLGMLSAIGIGLLIYIAVAFWLNIHATPEALIKDNLIMRDLALWKWAIIAGIMGATLSSALGSILGAPRILSALGQDRVIPLASLWSKRSRSGEPRYSLLLTAIIVEMSIILGDLNSIAPLLTMFFLITYGMINIAVFIEKAVGITSFRPSFRIPKSISFIGGIWCFVIMFLIDPIFALVSFFIIALFYMIQVKRELQAPWGDIRSALFNSISEWAAKTSSKMPQTAKNWKPNLMIPVEDPKNWDHLIDFINDLAFPKGTVRFFSVIAHSDQIGKRTRSIADFFFNRGEKIYMPGNPERRKSLENQMKDLTEPVRKMGIFSTSMVIEAPGFLDGLHIITQVMKGMFFPPNIMFLTMSDDRSKDKRLEQLIAISIEEHLGLLVMGANRSNTVLKKRKVNLWLRDKSPNQNLAALITIELNRSWGKLKLVRVTPSEKRLEFEKEDLRRIKDEARLPSGMELEVIVGDFFETLKDPKLAADLNIFGISGKMNIEVMHRIVDETGSSCIFAKDSGVEDYLV